MVQRKSLSRRQFLHLSGTVSAATLLAACAASGQPAAPAAEQGAAQSGGAGLASADMPGILSADMPGSPNHAKGWTTVLPDIPAGVSTEPTTISVTRRVDAQTKFAEGDSLESNPWSRMIQKLFGVTFEIAWIWSTTDEANSKYNLALASGDIPDYLETVPLNIFVQMVPITNFCVYQ